MPRLSRLPRLTRAVVLAAALVLPSLAHATLDAPVTPNAQPGVWSLLQVLDRTSGHYVLSGQQEFPGWDEATDNSRNVDFDYIKAKTGKVPVVHGFDFLFYTHSAAGRAGQHSSERAIAWAKKGGIVAFCCHMFMDIGSPADGPQFYVPAANNGKGTTFDIRQAVLAGTPENKEYLAKLDILAAELKKLNDAGVPVIWRPFHECSGGWFWWGAHGADGFKKAWRIMFDRFTKTHGLTNLIWCYNPTDSAAKMKEWYPGDDVVDLVSLDFYPSAGTHPTEAADYKAVRAFKAGRKLVTMSENGAIPDPDKFFTEGAGWAYFCTWNGFESNTAQNAVAFLSKVYKHAKVVTLDEYPAIVAADGLAIVQQPLPQVVATGAALKLSVTATGTGTLGYQWYQAGKAIAGATKPTYTVAKAAASTAGIYTVTVKTTKASVTSAPAPVTVAKTASGRLTRFTALTLVGPGERNVSLAFSTSTGADKKAFLLRALGPALKTATFTSWLTDPTLTLKTSPAITNDNWGSNPQTSAATLKSTFAKLGATALASGSKDAALLVTLGRGNYTAVTAGVGGSTGTALTELYDGAPVGGLRLVKVTARAQVTNSSPLTAGFVITGDPRMVLIRGIGGAALTAAGIKAPLANPKLSLYRVASGKSTLVATNDDWSDGDYPATTLGPIFAKTGASQRPIFNSDAVLLQSLAPGTYTVQLTSSDQTSGVALCEIYEVP